VDWAVLTIHSISYQSNTLSPYYSSEPACCSCNVDLSVLFEDLRTCPGKSGRSLISHLSLPLWWMRLSYRPTFIGSFKRSDYSGPLPSFLLASISSITFTDLFYPVGPKFPYSCHLMPASLNSHAPDETIRQVRTSWVSTGQQLQLRMLWRRAEW
jgi:hypothetical protein